MYAHAKQDLNSYITWKPVWLTCQVLGICHTFTTFISTKETLLSYDFSPDQLTA